MAGASQVEFWSPGPSFLPEGPRCYVIAAWRYSFVVGRPPAHRKDEMADPAAGEPHLSFTLKDSSTRLKRPISVDKRAAHNPPDCLFPACGERQICNVNPVASSAPQQQFVIWGTFRWAARLLFRMNAVRSGWVSIWGSCGRPPGPRCTGSLDDAQGCPLDISSSNFPRPPHFVFLIRTDFGLHFSCRVQQGSN